MDPEELGLSRRQTIAPAAWVEDCIGDMRPTQVTLRQLSN